jgi:hypothetical protein
VNIDNLASCCVADEVVQKVRAHIGDRLSERTLPAVQRRYLNDVGQSMDAALLPAVKKMARSAAEEGDRLLQPTCDAVRRNGRAARVRAPVHNLTADRGCAAERLL